MTVSTPATPHFLAVENGFVADLRREEDHRSYAARLRHGVIGRGLNDYDVIFPTLRTAGFDGWISIEDIVDGPAQLQESVSFLRTKTGQYWPADHENVCSEKQQ
jgi:sugar phosphate isomerase/epimerase